MKFQVGRFTCELSRSYTGGVVVTWFRRTEPPKYLTKGEREQYRAGRTAFLKKITRSQERTTP
jgi:hypothetical protein